MSPIDMTRIKHAVSHSRALIDLFGDIRKQLGALELRELFSMGRRRSPLAAAAWFSAGVVTGATAATIFAPKSGGELRQDIARTAEKIIDPIARKWRARFESTAEANGGEAPSEERAHPIHS